jgi:hypothetical protein
MAQETSYRPRGKGAGLHKWDSNVSDTEHVENGGSIANEAFEVDTRSTPAALINAADDHGCRRYLNKGDVSNLTTFVIMAVFIVLQSQFPGDLIRGRCDHCRLSSTVIHLDPQRIQSRAE